ncbi:hypothetical protein [Rhizobium leguminosarum]|uniref:hypothetical protein n=1 Tax=Rhizobium leguminosarum TaxID=384 RepID=UPI001039DDE3|nr:hypothetical protein [Rhizobium leguminosarum]TCA26255.1 hypothetical protein E0H67_04870 [Rhizobium leguminosarum bv. viciae]
MTPGQRAAHLQKLRDDAARDANLDPWSNGKHSNKGELPGDRDRAPLVDGTKCVRMKQKADGKIDWDNLWIKNNCRFPVQILICTYDIGDDERCLNRNVWGTTDLASPGREVWTVATAKRFPYKIKFFTCDMTGAKTNKAMLCLLPKTLK